MAANPPKPAPTSAMKRAVDAIGKLLQAPRAAAGGVPGINATMPPPAPPQPPNTPDPFAPVPIIGQRG